MLQPAGGGLGEHAGLVRARAAPSGRSASAPKAAAERRTAPTLCGSVTWSSTTTSFASARSAMSRLGQGIGEDGDPLMHGAGAGQPLDLARLDGGGEIARCRASARRCERVLRGEQPADRAARVPQRRERAVPAVDDVRAARRAAGARSVAGLPSRVSVVAPSVQCSRRRGPASPARAGRQLLTGRARPAYTPATEPSARGSRFFKPDSGRTGPGECPEWQRGRTVNPLAYSLRRFESYLSHHPALRARLRSGGRVLGAACRLGERCLIWSLTRARV